MLYAIVAVIILILDQAVKFWTVSNIASGATSPLIPGFVQFTYVQNKGMAFGLGSDGNWRWVFVILTIVVVIGIIYVLSKGIVKGKLGRWMLILVIAGGLGNCIDRALNGYVVDMFQFQFMNFAIFNVSDIFITVGGIVFCIYLIFHREPVEETPEPSRMPSRQMPTERPVKADYITQLKRPVVEGRRNIEAELAAKDEARAARTSDSVISDWNMPDDFAVEKAPEEKPATPRPAPAPATDFNALFIAPAAPAAPKPVVAPAPQPVAKPEPMEAVSETPIAEPPKPAKKSDEFSLDDIIAEFKD